MTIESRDKDRNEDDPRFLAVKEGFFTFGLPGERYREEWKAERSNFISRKNQSSDVEMTDIEPAPETMTTIVESADGLQ